MFCIPNWWLFLVLGLVVIPMAYFDCPSASIFAQTKGNLGFFDFFLSCKIDCGKCDDDSIDLWFLIIDPCPILRVSYEQYTYICSSLLWTKKTPLNSLSLCNNFTMTTTCKRPQYARIASHMHGGSLILLRRKSMIEM